ncbi:MAG: hypothetical protein AAF228_08385 [Pseudomonadota bacterium]
MKEKLAEIKAWAEEKIATGEEPPWAWYQYMKLVETIDAISASIEATATIDTPQPEQHQDGHLQLVDETYSQGTRQPHPFEGTIKLPM